MKRDTISDFGDSIKDSLGLSDNGIMDELEDIDVSSTNILHDISTDDNNFRKPSIVYMTVGVTSMSSTVTRRHTSCMDTASLG